MLGIFLKQHRSISPFFHYHLIILNIAPFFEGFLDEELRLTTDRHEYDEVVKRS